MTRISRLELCQAVERLLSRELAVSDKRVRNYALNPFAPRIPYIKFVLECAGVEDTEFASFLTDFAIDTGHSIVIPKLDTITQLAIKVANVRREKIASLDDIQALSELD